MRRCQERRRTRQDDATLGTASETVRACARSSRTRGWKVAPPHVATCYPRRTRPPPPPPQPGPFSEAAQACASGAGGGLDRDRSPALCGGRAPSISGPCLPPPGALKEPLFGVAVPWLLQTAGAKMLAELSRFRNARVLEPLGRKSSAARQLWCESRGRRRPPTERRGVPQE